MCLSKCVRVLVLDGRLAAACPDALLALFQPLLPVLCKDLACVTGVLRPMVALLKLPD